VLLSNSEYCVALFWKAKKIALFFSLELTLVCLFFTKSEIPEIYGENKEQFFTHKKCTTTILTHQLLLLIKEQKINCVGNLIRYNQSEFSI
jgi:hypothetical protein